MVLAGCLIDNKIEKEFKRLGIKDSKQLTQKRREILAEKIKEKAETFEIVVIHPSDIDKKNAEGINLNKVEAIASSNIINRINKGYNKIKVVIDCPSPIISKWQDYVKTKVKNLSNLEVSCEHKADQNHIAVSAASILAKCVRETEMDKLKEKYGGEIGSGYCSDPSTCKFLEKHAKKYKDDGLFRQTWITWKRACVQAEQRKLV
ncbi:MAG: ribonuclease HII [Nanoarchaeota archaeon]|nr:ribonuclease HII [Nanoarchaeota archaeon]MBU1027803.1 ribonuclease HII [Nanoarchaeota archaeon]